MSETPSIGEYAAWLLWQREGRTQAEWDALNETERDGRYIDMHNRYELWKVAQAPSKGYEEGLAAGRKECQDRLRKLLVGIVNVEG